MNKISEFQFEKATVPITDLALCEPGSNTFTLIVGKNGIGKSRFISTIVERYIQNFSDSEHPHVDRRNSHSLILRQDFFPKVIAVSTSPFDKFKLPSRRSYSNALTPSSNYRYIGMRTFGIGTSSISLIGSAATGIIEKLHQRIGAEKLIKVFDSLGFDASIDMALNPAYKTDRMHMRSRYPNDEFYGDDWTKTEGEELVRKFEFKYGKRLSWQGREYLSKLTVEEIKSHFDNIVKIEELLQYEKAFTLNINFIEGSISLKNRVVHNLNMEDLFALLSVNLLKVIDLKIPKRGVGKISLRRASSGEQCMLVMMLGIAGHITDNSLIAIDEPEISLHPKWQEEFLPLLIEVFKDFKNCQFLIATHSPQIVSGLETQNGFVTVLDSNEIYHASKVKEMSADFQLAEIFGAPGSKNEYISRLCFNLLAQLKAKKKVTQEHTDTLRKIAGFKTSLDRNDPIAVLIDSLEEVYELYASN